MTDHEILSHHADLIGGAIGEAKYRVGRMAKAAERIDNDRLSALVDNLGSALDAAEEAFDELDEVIP